MQGDISKCFDTIDQNKLISLLRRRINDEKFLSLVKKLLVYTLKDINEKETLIRFGAPQGSVFGPLMANIYLHELDNFMRNMKSNYDKGLHRRRNPEYDRLYRKGGIKEARKTNYGDALDPNFRRLSYVRYADDFLIGIIGSKSDAKEIQNALYKFLEEELHLKLNIEKTKISNPRSHRIKFLGYIIGKSGPNAFTYIREYGGVKRKVRTIRRGQIFLKVDIKKVIKTLADKGFCNRNG